MKRKLLFGLLGGALGGIAMKAVVSAVDKKAFGLSTETDAKTAEVVCQHVGVSLRSTKDAALLGAAMHYSFAVGAGMAYAANIDKFPAMRTANGAAFGVALWLLGDEIAVSLAGLEDPFETPLHSHLSALAAHVVYGMILDAVVAKA